MEHQVVLVLQDQIQYFQQSRLPEEVEEAQLITVQELDYLVVLVVVAQEEHQEHLVTHLPLAHLKEMMVVHQDHILLHTEVVVAVELAVQEAQEMLAETQVDPVEMDHLQK